MERFLYLLDINTGILMLFATHLVEEGEGLLELGDLLLSKLVGHLGGLCGWKMHQKTEKTSFLLSGQRAKSSKIEKKKKNVMVSS
jgi:hypothetical protein